VFLANKYLLEWEKIYEKKSVIATHTTKTWWPLIAIFSIIIIIGLIIFNPISTFFSEENNETPIDVNEKYENAIVLVYHSFVYKINIGNEIIFITEENDDFILYEKGKTNPISITGTGFFVSNKGEIITNRHVAIPWEYNENIEELKTAIKNFAEYNAQSLSPSEQYKYFEELKTLNVSGQTIDLGIAMNNTHINSFSDFTPCVLSKESGKLDIDVAMLQTKTKTLPLNTINIINLREAVVDENKLKIGEKLYMIGYPAGFTLAVTKKGIMANYQEGQITRLPDGVDFGHNIATIGGGSGSPIFNIHGNIVGINYQGLTETQGFNMAVLAKYAVELTK